MKTAIPFLVLGLTIPAATPSYANFLTGNDLYEKCNGGNIEQMVCMGYIEGVSDSLDLARANNSRQQCVAVGVTAGQIKDVVVQYLAIHPEKRDWDAGILVISALGNAWGCKEK